MTFTDDFLAFVSEARTPHQFLSCSKKVLQNAKYEELVASEGWEVIPKKGFVIRGTRCLIAFNVNGTESSLVVGSYFNSPGFSVTSEPFDGPTNLKLISARPIGKPLAGTWYDRCFRLAGEVYLKNEGRLSTTFYDSKSAIATFPALSSTNVSYAKVSEAVDNFSAFPAMLGVRGHSLSAVIADSLSIPEGSILDYNLRLVDAQAPELVGADKSLACGQGLRELSSAFAALTAFLKNDPKEPLMNILILAGKDDDLEDPFIDLVLSRIVGRNNISFYAKSLFVGVQGTTAFHPNSPGKSPDAIHLGKGIAILQEGDLTARYVVRHAAEKIEVAVQNVASMNDFVADTRSSNLALIMSAKLGMPAVSVGQGILVPGSIRETLAVADLESLIKLLTEVSKTFEDSRLLL